MRSRSAQGKPGKPARARGLRNAAAAQTASAADGIGSTTRGLGTEALELRESLRDFAQFGKQTEVFETPATLDDGRTFRTVTYVNEFWTSKQRAASRLHEVSYR